MLDTSGTEPNNMKKINLDTPLNDVDFPYLNVHIKTRLLTNRIMTIGQLAGLERGDLEGMRRLGKKSIDTIEDFLEEHGMHLGWNTDSEQAEEKPVLQPDTHIDWEQRRYELVKSAMNGILTNGYPKTHNWLVVNDAIEIADEIIKKLKGETENDKTCTVL